MKKLIVLVAVLVIPSLVFAKNMETGVGIIVGVPTGITAKHWINSKNAVDGAFSIAGKSELYLHFDYPVWCPANTLTFAWGILFTFKTRGMSIPSVVCK